MGGGVGLGGWGSGLGAQGSCERRSEVFVKIQLFFGGGGWGVRLGEGGGGGQGGSERRIKVFEKINKKIGGGEGQYFNPKHSLSILKKDKKRKKLTEPGLEPTTSGLEKPVLLSTRPHTIIAITKYE